MRVIIIEDEKPSARRLQRMLNEFGISVEEMLHSVEESLIWFENNTAPDLIFLDIQLSDGLSFEIFEHVQIQSAIIFTTAYDEYALKAFKLNSIDYLLKPIDETELSNAIKKFNSYFEANYQVNFNLNELKSFLSIGSENQYKKRFSVKIGQHIKIIATEDIECIYSENKGTYIFTSEGRNYLIDAILDDLINQLPPETFFRVNRKFIVNLNAIKDIINYTNSRLQIKLTLFKEHEIIVARERVKEFKDWLE